MRSAYWYIPKTLLVTIYNSYSIRAYSQSATCNHVRFAYGYVRYYTVDVLPHHISLPWIVVDANHATTRRWKDDNYIIPKSGREIEDAAIQHRYGVIIYLTFRSEASTTHPRNKRLSGRRRNKTQETRLGARTRRKTKAGSTPWTYSARPHWKVVRPNSWKQNIFIYIPGIYIHTRHIHCGI